MTPEAQRDPMTEYGERLHKLLTEALDLAQAQLESEEPAPSGWQDLAQRTYAFRSGLPAGEDGLSDLQAFAMELEHTLLARSRLESHPPQRVLFFGETLLQARQTFDREMTQRLISLAQAMDEGQSGGS